MPTPSNEDPGVYINLSFLLKKLFSIVNSPVDKFNSDDGLKKFANIKLLLFLNLKAPTSDLSPFKESNCKRDNDSIPLP